MKIANFIKSLIPSLDRNTVVEDLRIQRAAIEEFALPAYKQAAKTMRNYSFKSPEAKAIDMALKQFTRRSGGNLFLAIQTLLEDTVAISMDLEDLIERSFAEEINREGMTFQRAQMIQLVDVTSLISRYSRRLLTYIYAAEAATHEGSPSLKEEMLEGDIEYIKTNLPVFVRAIGSISLASKDLVKVITSIPDVVVTNDNINSMHGQFGATRLDPLELNFIPSWANPIYHARVLLADWQMANYEEAKDELTGLQLRRLNLEMLNQGKADAKLQKQIDYYNNEVRKKTAKIEEMRERYA